MLNLLVYASFASAPIVDISGALRGLHWANCSDANLPKVERGMLELAKLPAKTLKPLIHSYLNVEKIQSKYNLKYERAHIAGRLRVKDVAVLTRLVLINVPPTNKGKWFGPMPELDKESPWKMKNGKLVLSPCGIQVGFMATLNAEGEYLYYSQRLARRFPE